MLQITMFLKPLNLRSSLHVGDQVLHSYKIIGEIIVQYMLFIFTFLDKIRDF
jgi:hypothetical protein